MATTPHRPQLSSTGWCWLALLLASTWLLPAMERPPTPVRVTAVQNLPIQPTVQLIGSTVAVERVTLAAERSGRLLKMTADIGDHVDAGQVIAEVDGDLLAAAITELEAQIAASRTAVTTAEAGLSFRIADVEAFTKAAETQAVPTIELRRAQRELSETRALIAQRQAEVARDQARLVTLKKQQQDLTVHAPIAGTIVARHRDPGAWVDAGTELVELIGDTVEVRANVPERHWPGVQTHAKALSAQLQRSPLTIPTAPLRIIPDLNRATRTFTVVAAVTDPALRLAPGLSLVVDLPIAAASDQLVVPPPAVIRGPQDHLFVLRSGANGGQSAVMLPVTVLTSAPAGMAIRAAGLAAGDQVVVEGNERLRPGQAVAPITAGQP